ncbi:uncharacterized protein LOC112342003 [Selaginella moellendorffii]|uniref:uncharacterized protein LOC112342003 n=1 Tax=Selaginella moellendorffii TaxID=88036 RepID=UPI000D1CC32A|nr:uncharacterized protein LOC112342003 [Selaginella moellendorffii]|eukprot:XP_024518855.1 uncharacterized protein LOC112342003 [Selaginella moellendorffii]
MKKRARQRKALRTVGEHSFCVVMRSELLSESCCLILPVPENYLSTAASSRGKAILETRSGVKWEIEYEAEAKSQTIRLGAAGWHAFSVYNQLNPGDSIVFTLAASSFMCFSVVLFGRDGVEKEAVPLPVTLDGDQQS